jgi:PKD repeat protein
VATFRDTNTASAASDFTATIAWGDGSTSAGTIGGSSGAFTVSGSHTYASAGTFALTVTLADDSPGSAAVTTTSTASVAVTPIGGGSLSGTGTPVSGFEFTPLGGVPVATFTRGDGSEPPSQFSAAIAWGDGSTSAGTVTQAGTTYTVLGSHTYTDERVYTVTVTVADATASTTLTTTATLQEELLPDGSRGTANQRFLGEVYRDLLHRAIDPLGLAVWGGFLDAGLSRTQVVELIETTGDEYRHAVVNDLFEQYLHRAADPLGLEYFTDLLKTGSTVEQVAAFIVGSPEYFQRHGSSNDGFLTALYPDALGRPIPPAEQATQNAALAGMSRNQMVATLFNSDAYRLQLVGHYYDTLLDRSLGSDPFGTVVWPRYLQEGLRDEVVIALILGDPQGEFFSKTAS